MNRRTSILLLVGGILSCNSTPSTPSYIIPTEHINVLSGESGKSLSSMYELEPDGHLIVTTPADSALLKVRQGLPEFIRKHRPEMFAKFYKYRFQIVCVLIHDKTFILINAVDEFILEGRPDRILQPIQVQDGGDSFWKIIYSVDKNSFNKLSINGSA